MNRPGRHKRADAADAHVAWPDLAAFYILLGVFAARPMIGEVFEHAQLSFLAALQPDDGPTPATTAWLDFIVLAVSAYTLVRRRRWRASPAAAIGVAVLVVAVAVSSLFAGDKHAAWLAGANLAIGVLGGLALATLLQARWMVHLLVAALLATGATTAIKCISQSTYEYEQTRKYWQEEHKPALIEQGFDPEDQLLVNFERRMLANEAQGFLAHPNVTASCLMMWLLVTAGVFVGTAVDGRFTRLLLIGLIAALLAAALWFTGSLGGQVGCAVGVAALAALGVLRWLLGWRAGRLLAVLVAGYVAIIGLVGAYGVVQGTLPHPSLQFRWYYWSAAGRAIQDAPLTGRGRENFAHAYMLYKPPESTEEVRNPHNLWLSLLSELGPLGLAGGALLAGLALLRGLGNLKPPEDERTNIPPDHDLTVARAAPLAVGLLAAHALFSGTPFGRPGVALVWGQEILLVWTLMFLVSVWLLADVVAGTARGRWLVLGLCAALVASLAHALLSFALLTPGGLAVFVLSAVAAGAVGRQPQCYVHELVKPHRWTGAVPIAIGVCALAAQLAIATVTSHVARASRHLDAALRSGDTRGVLSNAAILISGSQGNSAAARTGGRALLHLGRQPGLPDSQRLDLLKWAARAAETNIADNPHDTNNYILLARAHTELAAYWSSRSENAEALAALRSAADSSDRAVQRYPTNPRTRISAGQAWFEVWRQSGDALAAEQAAQHLEEALRIDGRRPPADSVRLRPRETDQVRRRLAQLRAPGSV